MKGSGQGRQVWRLIRPYWRMMALGSVLGLISGGTSALLLAAINRALHDPQATGWLGFAGLAGLVALSLSATALSGTANSLTGQRFIAGLRQDIAGRILRAPVDAMERLGSSRLMAVLTNDVDTVSAFTFNFSGYAIALAGVLGGLGYLAWLSWSVFLVALLSLGLGALIHVVVKRGWIRDYEGVRAAQDDLHRQYRAVIDGLKELKIDRRRRARVHSVLLKGAVNRIARLKGRAMRLFWLGDAASSACFFLAVGLLLAGRQVFGFDGAAISGAVIVLLYIKGPLSQLAAALPALDQARISFRRILELSAGIGQQDADIPLTVGPADGQTVREIRLEGVRYGFIDTRTGTAAFALGPVELALRAGEILFIVGENGAGKTTLVKLLLGLYRPREGRLLWDGTPVEGEERLDSYRQLFCAVSSDFFLFDDLPEEVDPERVERLLERLGLTSRVHFADGRFSTTDLSSGQRKRLALAQAWLDHRPFLVTDEWAADQDPAFRRQFYEEILPELKAAGRGLVVISHDDRYFHVADRIVHMKDGRIVQEEKTR